MKSLSNPALRVSICVAAVLAIVAVCRYATRVNPTTAALSLLIVVLIVAACCGLRYAAFLSVIAAPAFSYSFLPPVGSFVILDAQDGIALVAFLMTALVASGLSERARNQALKAARDRAPLAQPLVPGSGAPVVQRFVWLRRCRELMRPPLRRRFLASALMLLLAAGILGALHSTPPTALVHATVVDVESGIAHHDYTILIRGNRIANVGPNKRVPIPRNASIVDLSNTFVIPGLWDMHVHIRNDDDVVLPLYIANGIIGVRDMGGDLTVLRELRERIRKGAVRGPRIFFSGPILDGPGLNLPSVITVKNAEAARGAVKEVFDGSADFIKVYSFLSRESYFAIAQEAKRRRMSFAGHVPLTISVGEASDAGQRSIEHLSGTLIACSDRESQLRQQLWLSTEKMTVGGRLYSRHPYIALTGPMLNTFNAQKCEQLFQRFISNDTWQVPTLVAIRGLAFADDTDFQQSRTHLEYLDALGKQWLTSLGSPYFRQLGAADFAAEKKRFHKDLELVGAMHKAGVKLLAGSDSPNPFDVPGFGLHDELELLVKAGLTPADALRAATVNAATFLRIHDDGTVSPGKLANLVVLKADPLADIHNTREIHAVMLKGKLLQRSDLDRLLAGALTARRRRFGVLDW